MLLGGLSLGGSCADLYTQASQRYRGGDIHGKRKTVQVPLPRLWFYGYGE